MDFKIDTRNAIDALNFVEKNVGRPVAVSLNKMALTFVIGAKGVQGAMQLTPKADRAKIKAVSDKQLAGYVAAKLRKSGKLAKRGAKREKGQFSTAQFKNAMRFERQRRLRAAGYTAYAGWSNAAKAFGGRGVKGVTESTKKEARHGYGKKASPERLLSLLVNTAPAIEEIGYPAAQKALDNAAADQIVYAQKKIQELLNKVSA